MFRAKRRTVVTVTAVVAVLLAGALSVTLLTQANGSTSQTTEISQNSVEYHAGHRPLAPDFTGTSLTGSTIKLSSYRGQTVVLNFWGSWCSPCRAEAPILAGLSKQYSGQGVAFLGDDVDDTPASALAFTRAQGITYPSINDPGYAVVAQMSQATPVSDTPTTVVIDKTGHVVGKIFGALTTDQLISLIKDAAVTQ